MAFKLLTYANAYHANTSNMRINLIVLILNLMCCSSSGCKRLQ